MTEPTDAELDAVLYKHWPAFSMQATLVRMWVRAAMRAAIVKWGTPPSRASRPKAAPGDTLDEVMRERDEAEDFINELLDEVLGADRPEWSSAYNRYDAMSDVRERITALHKPTVDKAWDQLQSAMAAPQQEPAATVIKKGADRQWMSERLGGLPDGIYSLYLAPQQEAQEPVAWESTILGYIKYITQARYEKFSPAVRRWYKPYRCSGCAERGAGFDACDMATAAAQGFRSGQAAAKQEG